MIYPIVHGPLGLDTLKNAWEFVMQDNDWLQNSQIQFRERENEGLENIKRKKKRGRVVKQAGEMRERERERERERTPKKAVIRIESICLQL